MTKSFLPILLLATTAFAQQITTTRGIIEGEPTADGQVVAYKGIPYAAPPIGDLRWAAPVPAAAWSGIRPAKDFGNHCIQAVTYNDMAFHDPGPSEDCLTLNVWTPNGTRPGTLPVMVWIYGGGLSGGSTSERRQDGQFLAHRNVVVVSMNYRLVIFGFFVHPGLTAESPHHASGNYGLLDQAAALQWVKDNITAFGGDPNNITLFGESAGSFSVSAHMASPVSRTLFHKAIGESGGALDAAPGSARAQREKTDSDLALALYGTSSIAALRRLPTEDIIRPLAATHPRFGISIDGYFFPKSAAEIYAAGEQAHIPLLAGWNADEGRGGLVGGNSIFTAAGFQETAAKDFPTRTQEFLQLYPATTEAQALASAADYAGDKFIAFSTWRWIEAHTTSGNAPVYRYLFTLGNPGDRFHTAAAGAFHSDDIEYVFGTLDSRPEALWRPEDRKLSAQIQAYWTNFAHTGNPNTSTLSPNSTSASLPTWPAYKPTTYETMHLNANPTPHPDTNRPRYQFLNDHTPK